MAWTTGNADGDAADHRGWLIGHFLDDRYGLRSSDDVEVKWAHHPKGERRSEWVTGETRTTLIILVSGHYKLILRDGEQVMTRPGDYVLWGPGEDHSWEAVEDSIIVSVRWPSRT